MPAPSTASEFRQLLELSGLVERAQLKQALDEIETVDGPPQSATSLARSLVRQRLITGFHAEQLLAGRHKGFIVGKYKILKLLGTGGMGRVYLAEHRVMRRQVALKILPKRRANDPGAIARFQREARAVAALHHPNIVQAYDIDREGDLHFIVMECVEGMSIQEYVKTFGAIPWAQAADYIVQAADALEHANKAGLIHRDIKPGNLVVDRTGRIKLLDMGLAVFYGEKEGDPLTLTNDDNVLGTADYLAPEQAIDSHNVDIRADIYSLGGTFYYMLTGGPPFPNGTVTQKLLWHQAKAPRSIREINPEVPEPICAVAEKMMAKKPADRFQTPVEVQEALRPFARRVDVPFAEPPDLLGTGSDWNLGSPAGAGDARRQAGGVSPFRVAHESSPAGAIPHDRGSPEATNGSSIEETPVPEPRLPAGTGAKATLSAAPADSATQRARKPPERLRATATPIPGKPAAAQVKQTPPKPAPVPTEELEEIPLLGAQPAAAASDDDFLAAIRNASLAPAPAPAGTPAAVPAAETVPTPVVRPPKRRRFAIAASLVAILLVAAGGWVFGPKYFVRPVPPRPDDSPTVTSPPSAPPRQILVPSMQAHDVLEGLYLAATGQTVLLKEPGPWPTRPLRVNPLYIDGKENVTLAAEAAQTVIQLEKASDGPLLLIENTRGFVLRNLILDGNGAAGPIVEIRGPHVAGVTIENCTIRNFLGDALRIANADGTANERLVLRDVTIVHATAGGSSVVFAPHGEAPPTASRHVEIVGCRFQGPFQNALMLAQAVEPLTVRSTAFVGGRVGLRLEAPKADWSQVSLLRATFENVPTRIESAVGPEAAKLVRVTEVENTRPAAKSAR